MILLTSSISGQALNATLIGRWAYGPCSSVDVVSNIAYFGNGGYLEIVDVSDPANPVELGRILIPSCVEGIAINGNHAYVADDDAGLRIIDVFDPSHPTETGFFDTGCRANAVAVSGAYAYMADGPNGLYIIRNDLVVGIEDKTAPIAKNFMLNQNYPNPFNPVTTISFNLPKSSHVRLSIHDSNGRLVTTLIDEKKNAGYHSVKWNAENMSSGVYFYRIEADGFNSVKKCLLVK